LPNAPLCVAKQRLPSRQDVVMTNCSTIVCAVDFSEHSKMALHRAAAWALHFSARLIVVTVVEPLLVNAAAAEYDTDLVREEVLPELRDFVARTLLAGGPAFPAAESMVLVGEPAAEIVALARREHAQLVVIATHGLSGYRKLLLGSTAEKVLRQTAVPVLLAPPPEQTPPNVDPSQIDVGRVLVPVDFKDGCVTEVRAAASLAETFGVPLLLVHVVAPLKGIERLRPHLETHNRVQIERADQQIQQLASEVSTPVRIETVVTVGSPAEEIAQIAVARGAGLVVMGLRRQDHVFGPRPGSIAYRVLSLAPARVLALPPGEGHGEWLHATSSSCTNTD
jgi:nucleotide-binding universal stress UspA family protein